MNETGIEVRELPPDGPDQIGWAAQQNYARRSELERAFERGRGDRWVTLVCGIAIGAAGASVWWGLGWLLN